MSKSSTKRSKRTGHKAVQLSQPKIQAKSKQQKSIEILERAIKEKHVAVILRYKRRSGFETKEIFGQGEFDKVLYDLMYHYDSHLFSEHIDGLNIANVYSVVRFDKLSNEVVQEILK